MYANYHTHTFLCHHATGTPRQYIEQAISSGIKILGFSDHVPYPFNNDYKSTFRMDVEQTYQYVSMLQQLREEYKQYIKIFIGYEAEYYPDIFEKMIKNITDYECDYLILGQHALKNEYDGSFCRVYTNDNGKLTEYVCQVCEAMETMKFSCVAHPDLLQYRGEDDFYINEMSKLCKCAKKLSIPLEINLLGLKEKRPYPYSLFWKVAGNIGNEVIFGCDAHSFTDIANKETEQLALKFADDFGLNVITRLKLRPVTVKS